MTDPILHQKLGRIEGLLEGLDKKVDNQATILTNQDARLRKVEVRSYFNGAFVSAVVALATAFFKDKFWGP